MAGRGVKRLLGFATEHGLDIEHGSKHWKIKKGGKLVAVIPYTGGAAKGRHERNVRATIRRHGRKEER